MSKIKKFLGRCVGLCGDQGVGKTTLARFMEKEYGWKRISFAQPIRDMLLGAGITEEQLAQKNKIIPHWERTPRYLMQTLGTEWGRDLVSKNLWLNLAEETAWYYLEIGRNVIFDDVRFSNEAVMIFRLARICGGGGVFRLQRPGMDKVVDPHKSENGFRVGEIQHHVTLSGMVPPDDLLALLRGPK